MASVKVPVTVTAEGVVASAVAEGFLLFSVEKIWVNVELRVGTADRNSGFNLLPPAGKEIVVRFPVVEDGTAHVPPENTISEVEFFGFLQRINQQNTNNLLKLSNLESF